MILKCSHDFVFIEKRNPVEKSIQKSFRIPIESLADTVDGYMIVHKLDSVITVLEDFTDEFFLDTVKTVKVARV